MSNLDHILLYCTMFFLAIVYDKQYRLNIKSYSHTIHPDINPPIAILLASIFIIAEGLRYGRGVDQVGNYGPFYLHCLSPKLYSQDMESLFVWLNQIVYHVDFTIGIIPFGLIFVVYAIIFWICLWILYKDYRHITKGFLLFAIFSTNYLTEWTIRQGVSFSFIFLCLHFLEKKKWIWTIICSIIVFGIHHGNVVSVLLIVCCYFLLNKKAFSWKITVPIFIILEYSMQVSTFLNIVQNIFSVVDLSGLGGNFQGYIEKGAFAQEAEFAKEWERGNLTQFMTVAFYSALIILGSLVCKIKPDKIFIYNVFVIGIMIFEPFKLAGTVSRLFLGPSTLWFIPLSLVLFRYKDLVHIKPHICMISKFIIYIYLILFYGRYVFLNPEANYIWNL